MHKCTLYSMVVPIISYLIISLLSFEKAYYK